MNSFRDKLKDKKRIVIKIGSSSLTHEKTGELNLFKIEKLIRVICDLKGEGKDVVWFLPVRSQQEGRLWAARNVLRPFQKNRLTRRLVRHADDGVPAYLF